MAYQKAVLIDDGQESEVVHFQFTPSVFDRGADGDEQRFVYRLHHFADGQSLPFLTRLFAQSFEREDAVQPPVARHGKMGVAVSGEDLINKFRDRQLRRHADGGRPHHRADRADHVRQIAVDLSHPLAGGLSFAVAVIVFGSRLNVARKKLAAARYRKDAPAACAAADPSAKRSTTNSHSQKKAASRNELTGPDTAMRNSAIGVGGSPMSRAHPPKICS